MDIGRRFGQNDLGLYLTIEDESGSLDCQPGLLPIQSKILFLDGVECYFGGLVRSQQNQHQLEAFPPYI
jgi:hypothetical protein